MKTILIVTIATVLSQGLLMPAQASSAGKAKEILKSIDFKIPKNMSKKLNAIQWTFKSSKLGMPVYSGERYQLVNMAINQGIKRYRRIKAANLGFLKSSSKKMNILVMKRKGSGQIRYGDLVALHLKPYGWLRYKKQGRAGGINLGDDDHKPHFIWRITGGKAGTRLVAGMPFALLNTSPVKREVIYCQRAYGIDLGWRGKSKCGGKLTRLSNAAFGANGALSGGGLTGKLARDWKDKLCKAAVGAAIAYASGQTGGIAAVGVDAAAPIAIKKCKSF